MNIFKTFIFKNHEYYDPFIRREFWGTFLDKLIINVYQPMIYR